MAAHAFVPGRSRDQKRRSWAAEILEADYLEVRLTAIALAPDAGTERMVGCYNRWPISVCFLVGASSGTQTIELQYVLQHHDPFQLVHVRAAHHRQHLQLARP